MANSLDLLVVMSVLGALTALTVSYGMFRHSSKSLVHVLVPGPSEHFAIRPGPINGEYFLDVIDARGKLVRTAGSLRPSSVTRAAVLPPDLAARLGAKDPFERFELTQDGRFVRSEKEEGYQVFPFTISPARKAS